MAMLKIEKRPCGGGLQTIRVEGFTNDELSELKSMEHREAEEKLLEMLDSRNHGLGTTYARGYGVYSVWFDNEFAYMNIGSSCD